MKQRVALMIATGMTAFVIVLMGGVGLTVAARRYVEANSIAPLPIPALQVAEQPTQPTATPAEVKTQFSADQAAQIAMKLAPNTKLTRTPELVNLQGTLAYDVVLNQGIIYVDANSGKVLFNGVTANTKPTATPTPARRASERPEANQGEHDD